MRVSGVVALLAFLTPAGYVVKYYGLDRPREEARAHTVTLTKLTPGVGVNAIAPPLTPARAGQRRRVLHAGDPVLRQSPRAR